MHSDVWGSFHLKLGEVFPELVTINSLDRLKIPGGKKYAMVGIRAPEGWNRKFCGTGSLACGVSMGLLIPLGQTRYHFSSLQI
jgi:hypothetical protein